MNNTHILRRNKQPFPIHIRELLASVPNRGDGLNAWIWKASLALRGHKTPEEIVSILYKATKVKGIHAGEIERAVMRSHDATLTTYKNPRWPKVNREEMEKIYRRGVNLDVLQSRSPVQCFGGEQQELLRGLFPGDPFICCAPHPRFPDTRRLSDWGGDLIRQQFIVPNPMTALVGLTQDGRKSARTLNNTATRRYLVIEHDHGSTDQQAAILLHLAERWPLSLVVHSGSKSLHGWFFVAGASDEKQKRLMLYAVYLGADPATWNRCQLVRMPWGIRHDDPDRGNNGKCQVVHFFNPQNTKCI